MLAGLCSKASLARVVVGREEEQLTDEKIVRLLEEIRDLQKLHVENYKDALKNQQEAILIQKQAVRRQKITQVVLGLLVLGALIAIAWTSR